MYPIGVKYSFICFFLFVKERGEEGGGGVAYLAMNGQNSVNSACVLTIITLL